MNSLRIQSLVRVTAFVVEDLGLKYNGVRHDGMVVGFTYSDSLIPDEYSILTYNAELNQFFVLSDHLSAKQYRALQGIATALEIDIIEDDGDMTDEDYDV